MNFLKKLKYLILPLTVIIIWEVTYTIFELYSSSVPTIFILIPKPTIILKEAFFSIINTNILLSLWQTLFTTFLGFSLGFIGAVFLGIWIGRNKIISELLIPSLHFLRTLPIALYIPIFLILFNSNIKLPISLCAFITVLYGIIPISRSANEYDIEKITFLKIRSYKPISIILNFILPEIFSSLKSTISITSTLSLAVTVVTEMLLQSLGGMGSLIINSKEVSNYNLLWAYILVLGISGYLFLSIIIKMWEFAFPWSKQQ